VTVIVSLKNYLVENPPLEWSLDSSLFFETPNLQETMSVELVEFATLGSLLEVVGLDLVNPLPQELGILVRTILPEGIQEPDDLVWFQKK